MAEIERRNLAQTTKSKPVPRRVRVSSDIARSGFKLVTRRQIHAVVDRIVESLNPEKVILFGSYAYGEPTIDSDVDLLVVMESDERPARRAVRIERELLDIPFPMDILVRTPDEVAKRLEIQDYFMREIIEQGQVLYERS